MNQIISGQFLRKPFLTIVFVFLISLMMTAGCSLQSEGLQSALDGLDNPTAQPDTGLHLSELEEFWIEECDLPEDAVAKMEVFTTTLLAKAQPDECFAGIGQPYPPGPPCTEGQAKVNQSYVWGLTKWDDVLWFGTAPNMICLVSGAMMSAAGFEGAMETASWVCEYGQSQIAKDRPDIPSDMGDWRQPQIFTYDRATEALVEKTGLIDDVDGLILLNSTTGFRSAGAHDGVVFMAGPGMGPMLMGGLNMFAFNAETGAYIGSTHLPEYDDIREWAVVKSVLYTTVKNSPTHPIPGGSILRWTGSLADPFQFQVVGLIDNEGAYLTEHRDRIFVSTWPSFLDPQNMVEAGLWRSPIIPVGGLTDQHIHLWEKIWTVSDYEPDPLVAQSYLGGALASFDGYLYWGSLHGVLAGALLNFQTYGIPSNPRNIAAVVLGTHRPISIFRSKFDDNNSKVQVLYGMTLVPVYNPNTQRFRLRTNNTGRPLYGPAGFGNFFNSYTWTMSVYDDKLFVGTMDVSYPMAEGLVSMLLQNITGTNASILAHLPGFRFGADLYCFKNTRSRAQTVSTDGLGNYTNYGIRTMLSDEQGLFMGMANPMNLLTNPNDNIPQGGWELIRLNTEQW